MLKALISKEFKELIRNPQIMIGFILSAVLMPLMGFAITIPMKEAVQQIAQPLNVGVIDLDSSFPSRQLFNFLNSVPQALKVRLLNVSAQAPLNLTKIAEENVDLDLVLVIPKGYGSMVMNKTFVKLQYLVIVKSSGFFGANNARYTILEQMIDNYLGAIYLQGTGIQLEIVKDPVRANISTFMARKGILLEGDPSQILSSLSFAAFLLPLALFTIAATVIQMSSTSMAVENEEKTLETLLTLPIPRSYILMAKLLGSFMVSIIGSVASLIGFVAYFYTFDIALQSVKQGFSIKTTSLLSLDYTNMLYLFASIIITLFFTAAVGTIVGALSKDTRVASTILGPTVSFIMIPAFVIAFMDVGSLSPIYKALVYSFPIVQTMAVLKEMVLGSLPAELPVYMGFSVALSIALLYVSSKLFSLETLSRLQRKVSSIRFLRKRGSRGGSP